jgi:rhodanese-related sulfurtransferase
LKLTSLARASRGVALAASFIAASALLPMAAQAQMDKASAETVASYFDFVDYNSGTIMVEQIPAEDWKRFYLLDVRDAGQYTKEHIPGAVNIEWRKVFAERAKLPKDKNILVYCNTGSFSGQVAMALRLDGFENVRILHGGFGAWQARK